MMRNGISGIYILGFAVSIILAAAVTTLAIYLTPLKAYNIVPPVMNEIDPKDFYALMKAHPDDYLLIDVRSSNIYDSAHAQGAINIPIENLYDDHYTLPKTGKKIALICTTGRLAAIAYGYLQYWGFTNLLHVEGGVQNWASEGLPLEGLRMRGLHAATTTLPTAQEDQHQ